MTSLTINVYRGNLIESRHKAICSIKNSRGKLILSTKNEKDLIYPRSAIKIFQALPLLKSKSFDKMNLNQKNIAIACSSHSAEKRHIVVLKNWLNKLKIKANTLECGIHAPLDNKAAENLLFDKKKPNQLHNNCSGKHLGMISGCISENISYKNYINFNHPYQKKIRTILEYFMNAKINKNSFAVDGCGAPQYAFQMGDLSNSMINLLLEKNKKSINGVAVNRALKAINKYPELIAGSNRFDTDVIKYTEGRIFCKGGAEGVLLFCDLKNKIGGVIKIIDGNERARASISMKIFLKLNLLSKKEKQFLSSWSETKILNHAKKKIGSIQAEIK
mgnify:CR=1 FL=1|tara:strand:- start:525 stop:1520 length:996 start_codon:yes stop_codon:yes gene_type:complete